MATTIQTIELPKKARALDTSGNNNHGQIYSGRALEFDGVSDYLSIADDASIRPTDNITVACWIRRNNAAASYETIFGKSNGWTNGVWLAMLSGQLRCELDGAISHNDFNSSAGALKLNVWYRIVMTYNTTDGGVLYINGQVVDTIAANGSITQASSTAYQIGGSGSYFLDGSMSNFQLWDTAWTAADVTYDYLNPELLALNRGGTSLTESNLKLWYPMQDGHRGQQSYILDGANTGIGDDLVTNGDFATDSDWTKGTGWTISGGKAIFSGSAFANLQASSNILVVGKTYELILTAEVTNGSFKVQSSGSSDLITQSSSGTYSTVFTATSTVFTIARASVGVQNDFTIDNISVKAINDKNHATTVFYGDELVTNGTFTGITQAASTAGSEWTTGAGWTIGSGIASRASESENTYLSQNVAIVAGRTYEVKYDRTYASGGGETNLYSEFITDGSNTTLGSLNSTVVETVTVTDTFTPTYSGDMLLRAYGIGDFTGTMDNITVKEIGVASGWTDADQQLHLPQTALQSYNELLWCTASEGTNAIVEVADNSNLDVDALDFSISCWIYPITESDYLPIFRKGGAGAEGYVLTINSSNYIALNLNDDNSNSGYTNLTDAVVPSGKWSHVVVTCDRDSATGIRCYLNGVLQTATADPTGEDEDISNTSGVIFLGFSTSDADSFSGTATEFMLFKDSILSSSEVLELYNDGKALDGTTHSLFSTKCTAYYRNNGLSSWSNLATVADSGATTTAAAAGTVSVGGTETILIPQGVDSTRDNQGFIMNRQKDTSSLNLDGIGYVEINETSNTLGVTSAATVCAWVYQKASGYSSIISKQSILSYYAGNSSIKQRFYVNGTAYNSDTYLPINQWNHIAAVYDGSTVKFYLNGDADGSHSHSTDFNTNTNPMYIGSTYVKSTEMLDEVIDGVLVYNSALDETEISRNYNATKGSHRN